MEGFSGPLPDLVPVSNEAGEVGVEVRLGSGVRTVEDVRDDRVTMSTRHGSVLRVTRDPAAIDLVAPLALSAEALVHPMLTAPLSMLARWRGDVTLHGGAFHHAGGAWGILGARTAGKSSMLGALGASGVPIVADDLLVVDRGRIHAGPSCVDLRPDVATRFSAARDLGVVGTRPRWRLSTAAAPPLALLRGLFVLEWHEDDRPVVEEVETAERLRILYKQEAIALLGFADPSEFVALAGLPTYRLLRRRRWEATTAAMDCLLRTAEAHAG